MSGNFVGPIDVENKPDVHHVEHTAAEAELENVLHKRRGANTQLDDAANLLASAGGPIDASAEERRRVLRKIDLYVCVPMCIVYTIQQLDKSSVSYAAVFDLQADTGLVGSQYSWLSSCGYLAQLFFQSTSAYALVLLPVKYWVLFNMIAWSIVTICTGAAKNFAGLLVARVFLGIFESTILPSFILITQMWYTRRENSYRTVAYQISNSVASMLGPLMAFGIGEATTNSSSAILPYQGIFIFLGSVSLAFAPLVWWLLPNSPTTAKFLRHGNDRLIALERVRENNTGTKASKWDWAQFWETMKDLKTWLWVLMFLCVTIPNGGIGTFGGLITKGFGFNSFITIVMQIPVGAIGIITLVIAIFVTNKIKIRWVVICTLIVPIIGGAVGLIYVPRSNIGGLVGCYYTVYLIAALQPLMYAWANLNAAGTTKRVVTTACLFVGQCAGNIIGPQLYFSREAPYYYTGLYSDIGCWCLLFITIMTQGLYLRHLNKKKRQRRIELGLPADLEDMSIMSLDEADRYRVRLTDELRRNGVDENKLFEAAFDDMTDIENPLFMYVY